MVFARAISARLMAKSRIDPATPATTHNRRGSPWSEIKLIPHEENSENQPSTRTESPRHEPARWCLCSRIHCCARHLTASRSFTKLKTQKTRRGTPVYQVRHRRVCDHSLRRQSEGR